MADYKDPAPEGVVINKDLAGLILDEWGAYGKSSGKRVYPSYASTMKQVLELIDLYWIDKFKESDYNSRGWKRAFYNVVVNPSLTSSKQIDVDTKDVLVKAEEGQSYYPAWLLGRDLKLYMKFKNFGIILNAVIHNLPKYGSILLQKAGDTIYLVPLKDVAMESEVDDLHDSSFIIQRYEYTPFTLRKQKSWNQTAIEHIIKTEYKKGEKICCYSRFGEVSGSTDNYFIVSAMGTILTQDKFDDVNELYRMHSWDKIPGRILGRGQVEKLFEAQIQTNRIENYKTEGLHWSSKHIFQTRDQNFKKNLTTDVENGDVLTPTSELTPVAVEERNLAAYNQSEGRWDRLISSLSYAFPELSGERPPAGTPLGTTQLNTAQASSFFDLRREELGLFLKGVIFDWVIPSFKKYSYAEHSIMLGELDNDEISKIRNTFSTYYANKDLVDYITTNKTFPDFKTAELIRSIAKDRVSREKEIKIPAGFYDNVKFKIDVVITNEQIDTASRIATIQTVIGMLNNNPEILSNPRVKAWLDKALELSGFNPIEIGGVDENPGVNEVLPALRPGGSIAKPNVPRNGTVTKVANAV